MPKSLPKIIASILLGVVFLLGGARVVSAAQWTFNYTTKAAPSVSNEYTPSLADETACNTRRALYLADTATYDNVYTCRVATASTGSGAIGATQAPQPSGGYSFLWTPTGATTGTWSQVYSDSTTCNAGKPSSGGTAGSCLLSQGTGVSSSGAVAGTYTGPEELKNFDCGIWGKSTLTACLPIGTYYLIYKPVSVIFMGTGYLFDVMLDLSIKKAFVDQDFIDSSWTIMRDFSNMAFIFVLLYTGIATMLGTPGWAKTVRNVVIIALLINFSLFFTKVVIDAGNVLAVGVSEAIKAGEPSISEGLVKKFEPQNFLGTAGELTDAMDAIIIFIIAAIINGYAAYIFFKSALLFLGRLIAFWFLMIVSPFAFISITLPKGNVFNGWLDTLLKQSFVAPVYLFLIYLILQIINAGGTGILGGLGTVASGSFIFDKLLAPIIMATLILFALQQALKLAEKMAGDFGAMGSKMAGSVMGVAGGLALGGTALALRAGVGGVASRSLQRGMKTESELAAMSEGERSKYQSSRARLQTLTQSSFDVRALAGEKSVLGKTVGGLISKGGGAFGVNVGKATLGGVEKEAKDAEKKAVDNVPKLSIFEEQEISRRSTKQAEKNKDEVAKAEADLIAAQKAYDDSGVESKLAEAKAAVETATSNAAEASKKTKAAQAAFDAAKASGSRSNAPWEALNEARKTEEQAMQGLAVAEGDVLAATTTRANSAATAALKTATETIEKAKGKETDSEKLAAAEIKKENTRRRNEYADNVEKHGTPVPFSTKRVEATHTANKIRKGEESGHAKKLKELTAKKKKAEEESKSEDYIKAIDDQIKEAKGEVKKEEEIKK